MWTSVNRLRSPLVRKRVLIWQAKDFNLSFRFHFTHVENTFRFTSNYTPFLPLQLHAYPDPRASCVTTHFRKDCIFYRPQRLPLYISAVNQNYSFLIPIISESILLFFFTAIPRAEILHNWVWKIKQKWCICLR